MEEINNGVILEKINNLNAKIDSFIHNHTQVIPKVQQSMLELQIDVERIKTRDDSQIHNNNIGLKILSVLMGLFVTIATGAAIVFYDSQRDQVRYSEENRERTHENSLENIRLEGKINQCVLKK